MGATEPTPYPPPLNSVNPDLCIPLQAYLEVPLQAYLEVPLQAYLEVPLQAYLEVPLQAYLEVPLQAYLEVPLQAYLEVMCVAGLHYFSFMRGNCFTVAESPTSSGLSRRKSFCCATSWRLVPTPC
jgi:hypothetical protein